MTNKTRTLVNCAVIAAIYAVVTVVFMPISYGLMQVRVSEALTILPAFSPYASFGLGIGCLIANILGGASIFDIVFGSLATLAAGFLSYKLRKHKWLVPIPPIVLNAVVVGSLLCYVYEVGVSLPWCMLYVGVGEAISCYVFGMILYTILNKLPNKNKLFIGCDI